MSSVTALHALWQKTFTPTLTPARKGGAAAFGLHPGAKTVLTFPRAFGSLKRAFHKRGPLEESAYGMRLERVVNAAAFLDDPVCQHSWFLK